MRSPTIRAAILFAAFTFTSLAGLAGETPRAEASSDFSSGVHGFKQFGASFSCPCRHFTAGVDGVKRAGDRSRDSRAFCRLYLGPRDEIPEGQFVLRIGDFSFRDGDELVVMGTATEEADGQLLLVGDRIEAQAYFEEVVRREFGRPAADFDLHDLDVRVRKTARDRGPDDVTCTVEIRGAVVGGNQSSIVNARIGGGRVPKSTSIARLRYVGEGLTIPGVEDDLGDAASSTIAEGAEDAEAPAANGSCPVPTLAPVPSQCATPNCLVTFAGLQWWTSYEYFPGSGFYNMNNAWSPKNVTVDAEGLHLFVRQQNVGGGLQWTAAEAVAMFNADGSQVDHGYGTYLVSARVKTAPSFAMLDPNVAFGAFTYERDRTGSSLNPGRELDLAEISHWGNTPGNCTSSDPRLCDGNAQFTVQEYNRQQDNLHRYTIPGSPTEITLVMKWTGEGQPVTFSQYNGTYTLANLPATPNNSWTTSPDQNQFIPASNCQRFHLNLWMGAFQRASGGYNPPPNGVQEIVVTNFQYQAQP